MENAGERAQRYPAHMWARLHTESRDLPVTLRNISTSGAYVVTQNAFASLGSPPPVHDIGPGENGSLRVRSYRSRVEVELPCRVARTEAHGVGVQFQQPPSTTQLWLDNYCRPEASRQRVVMVDDEPSLLAMMDIFLTAAGYRFYGIDIPVGSETTIADFKPDLIILDINMPVVDGPTLAKKLDAANIKVPVLYHSAANLELVRQLIGDAPFMAKGARRAEIVAEIQRLLANARPTA